MYARPQSIPHFMPKSVAGKSPRGQIRDVLATQIPKMATRTMGQQMPVDLFPNWQYMVGQGFFPYLEQRRTFSGGRPGARYF